MNKILFWMHPKLNDVPGRVPAMEVLIKIRQPKVGDRVAIPNHAIVFFIKSVNEANKTVDAEAFADNPRIEKNIPWKSLTFIDL